jgi:hypothetical protein
MKDKKIFLGYAAARFLAKKNLYIHKLVIKLFRCEHVSRKVTYINFLGVLRSTHSNACCEYSAVIIVYGFNNTSHDVTSPGYL